LKLGNEQARHWAGLRAQLESVAALDLARQDGEDAHRQENRVFGGGRAEGIPQPGNLRLLLGGDIEVLPLGFRCHRALSLLDESQGEYTVLLPHSHEGKVADSYACLLWGLHQVKVSALPQTARIAACPPSLRRATIGAEADDDANEPGGAAVDLGAGCCGAGWERGSRRPAAACPAAIL